MSELATPRQTVVALMLAEMLQFLRRRARRIGLATAAGWGVVIGLLALAAFAWTDLLVELPPEWRLACTIASVVVACAGAVRVALRWRQSAQPLKLAQRLDELGGCQGQILTAVDLAACTPATQSPVGQGLAALAVAKGCRLAQSVNPVAALPIKPLGRPILALAGIMVAGLVLLAWPGLLSTQWERFVDPFGDHPPYSSLKFDVQPGNARVVYGGNIDIRATITGGVADRAELVLDGAGAAAQALPMFPEGQGLWRATVVNVVDGQRYFVRAGRARSVHYDLGVITVPQLTDVRFHIQLPAYTNRPPYDGPVPRNGIAGLKGTTVQVTALSNRPLSGGVIAFTTSDSSPVKTAINMTPLASGSNQVVGTFTIASAGRVSVGVRDVDGQDSSETLDASVTLLIDAKPIIRILEPKPESFASPDASINVQAMAEDDYGLSRVEIYRGLNQSRAWPVEAPVPSPPPTQFLATLPMHLSEYGVRPGDVIQLFGRAEDNDPAGPKGSESTVTTIHIVSQQEMDQMLVERQGLDTLLSKYASARRRVEADDAKLEALEKELEKLDPKSPLAQELRKQIADLSKQMGDDADAIDKLATHGLPFDLDAALTPRLKELADALRQAQKQGEATATTQSIPSVAGALDQLRKMRQQLGVESKNFDQEATAPLQYLAKIYPLLNDQARFLELHDRQKDLAQRMASLKDQAGADDPRAKARMRDLEDEQRQVANDLEDLLNDIDNHVAALPDDKKLDDLRDTAKQFCAGVRASPAFDQMSAAALALGDFTGSSAAKNAADAEATLDQFIKRCQSMGNQTCTCLKFQPELAAGMGSTLSQLQDMMGLGAGGGYTAMRSSLRNIGLYGTLPLHGEESGSQAGGSADRGIQSHSNGAVPDFANPEGADAASGQQAVGQGDAVVPPEYRQRVGEYFRRVADELSQ